MTDDTNMLERALRAAASDPASRPDFYRLLLHSDIFVIGRTARAGSGQVKLGAGEELQIHNWTRQDGSPVLPFFTSLRALREVLDAEVSYIELSARSFFDMTRGAALVLNPKSPYGKEFFPNEIEALLSDAVNRLPDQRTVQKPTQVLLGQPAQYPTAMVEALAAFLAKRPQARAGYLALMHDRSVDERPHLMIGIHAEGDAAQLLREAGAVAGDTSPAGEPIDMCVVTPGATGLSAYFLASVKPFYERRPDEAARGSWLKRLLGRG